MTVIPGARDLNKGEAAAKKLADDNLQVVVRRFDITDQDSSDSLTVEVEREFGRLDVLVNNVAILYDSWQQAEIANLETVRDAFETNTLGAPRRVEEGAASVIWAAALPDNGPTGSFFRDGEPLA